MATQKELELAKEKILSLELDNRFAQFEKKINDSIDKKFKDINSKLTKPKKITNKQVALIISTGVVIFSFLFKGVDKNMVLIQFLKELLK